MTADQKNPILKKLIIDLEKQSRKQKVNIWQRVAADLSRPTRIMRTVNVSSIARNTQANNAIIVPGKVLASGVIAHAVNVVAYTVSDAAKQKIVAAGGSVKSIRDEMEKNPKGSALRIIG